MARGVCLCLRVMVVSGNGRSRIFHSSMSRDTSSLCYAISAATGQHGAAGHRQDVIALAPVQQGSQGHLFPAAAACCCCCPLLLACCCLPAAAAGRCG